MSRRTNHMKFSELIALAGGRKRYIFNPFRNLVKAVMKATEGNAVNRLRAVEFMNSRTVDIHIGMGFLTLGIVQAVLSVMFFVMFTNGPVDNDVGGAILCTMFMSLFSLIPLTLLNILLCHLKWVSEKKFLPKEGLIIKPNISDTGLDSLNYLFSEDRYNLQCRLTETGMSVQDIGKLNKLGYAMQAHQRSRSQLNTMGVEFSAQDIKLSEGNLLLINRAVNTSAQDKEITHENKTFHGTGMNSLIELASGLKHKAARNNGYE